MVAWLVSYTWGQVSGFRFEVEFIRVGVHVSMKSKSPNVKLLVLTATANNSRSDKKRCAALMSSFPDFSEVSSSFLFLLLLRFAVRQHSYSRTPAEASIQGVYFRREAEGLETCLHSGRGGRPRKLFPGRLRLLLYKASIIPGARRKASKLVVSSFRARDGRPHSRSEAEGLKTCFQFPGQRRQAPFQVRGRKASKLVVSSFRARAQAAGPIPGARRKAFFLSILPGEVEEGL